MTDDLLKPNDPNYMNFLKDVKAQVQATRIQAARAMNKHLIQFYWWLGEEIVKRQERFGWGKTVVEQLAKDLRESFPNTKGFSARNLWRTRQFFLEYKDYPNLPQLAAEIPWMHNDLIINKIKDYAAREFYIRESAKWGWSRNVLAFQIEADLYHRQHLAAKKNNFEETLPAILADQAHESMKSTYMLDMLGLSHPAQEAEIEDKMVRIIQRVMLELGQGLSFIGNQYPVRVKGKDYFIDLLFFSRPLQCLVAVELKATSYKPEYAGKLGFYLALLDDFVRLPHENKSIGMVLCKEHDSIEVEYSLKTIRNPVGVADYSLEKALPDPEALQAELQRQLALEEGSGGDDE